MKPRTRSRLVAFQFLYRLDLTQRLQTFTSVDWTQANGLAGEVTTHLEHFEVPEVSRNYATQIIAHALSQLPRIDDLIESAADHWRLERMTPVDRNLLRVGIAEVECSPDLALPIILDETIELGKQFGSEDTRRFINGILDAIGNQIRGTSSSRSSPPTA